MDSWLFKHVTKIWAVLFVLFLSLGLGWLGFVVWVVIQGLSIAEAAVQ